MRIREWLKDWDWPNAVGEVSPCIHTVGRAVGGRVGGGRGALLAPALPPLAAARSTAARARLPQAVAPRGRGRAWRRSR
jgi:hypothetical protein